MCLCVFLTIRPLFGTLGWLGLLRSSSLWLLTRSRAANIKSAAKPSALVRDIVVKPSSKSSIERSYGYECIEVHRLGYIHKIFLSLSEIKTWPFFHIYWAYHIFIVVLTYTKWGSHLQGSGQKKAGIVLQLGLIN